MDLPTKYEPQTKEEEIYAAWSGEKLFHADENSPKKRYSIVIPPPNITGILHMGHALNNTIQDILIRWKRMQNFEVLWMPGTDHAGIATQNVVERELAKDGIKRATLGREKFLEKVWEWKEKYGSTIIHQLKKLGCSCDWPRARFTMDEGLSDAVKEVFVRLYDDGLIYKGDYIINWCPRCTTALSDEEAEHRDIEGMLYYIKYPIKGREKLVKEGEDYIVVATTRPETMLGDVAVAVNPKDPRYEQLKGKKLILPIIKRELDLIFDESVDPAFGTGALKVTPAHDGVDFELAHKHGLKSVNVMNPDGSINELGNSYEGMDRFECREAIVEDLKERKLFIKSEKHFHAVGHCYRCHTVVEPRLSKPWFVNMKVLAEPGIKAVRDGRIRFFPERWTKVYLNWMENIRPWCISRQIWWGHRIPAYYCKSCQETGNLNEKIKEKGMIVSKERPEKCPDCGATDLYQDPDVLDTWFSSWLWPFSTLGWPAKTKELEEFYPTDALVTAQEIIFFWVARMIMAGLKFQKDIPFRDVYIHGTVRDSTGTKMSKSLGNTIDPLEIIRDFGSDALRYSLISITAQGQDVFLSKEKFELGRNFANKIWNAARYVLMSVDGKNLTLDIDRADLTLADKWILHSLNATVEKVTNDLGSYRFNDAAGALYDFIWHKYCDWYLEISKNAANKETVQKVLVKVLMEALRLLHPFMPFVTEEIWQHLPTERKKWIMTEKWPEPDKKYEDKKAFAGMSKIIGIITAVRNIRAFWNIEHTRQIDVFLSVKEEEDKRILSENISYIEQLARSSVKKIEIEIPRPTESVAALSEGVKVFVLVGGAIDIEKEKARIEKKIGDIGEYLNGINKKLTNKSFLEKAPEDVVGKEQAKKKNFEEQAANLRENLAALE